MALIFVGTGSSVKKKYRWIFQTQMSHFDLGKLATHEKWVNKIF
jgi:hypothetical protein